jgi:tellurite resistance protein TehA-like permease
MVMATGIVSIAMHLLGQAVLARALLAVNAALYAGLWALTLLRLARHRARLVADLRDHERGPGFSPRWPARACWAASACCWASRAARRWRCGG